MNETTEHTVSVPEGCELVSALTIYNSPDRWDLVSMAGDDVSRLYAREMMRETVGMIPGGAMLLARKRKPRKEILWETLRASEVAQTMREHADMYAVNILTDILCDLLNLDGREFGDDWAIVNDWLKQDLLVN